MKVISLLKVLRELNILKRKRIVKDYAIGGGIAKNYYLEPQFTYDLDIFILIDTMDDFHNIYKHFRKEKCKIENVFIFIKDVPVQFLPSFIHPLFEEAIKNGRKIRVGKVGTKVLTSEYLIATLLMSFRQKDREAIRELLSLTDMDLVKKIVRKFSNRDYPIYGRFREIVKRK